MRALVALLLLVALAGCQPYPCQRFVPSLTVPTARGDFTGRFANVRLLFATDRAPTGLHDPRLAFGVDRSPAPTYGTCSVTVPIPHCRGRVQESWFAWMRRPHRDVVLKEVAILDPAEPAAYVKMEPPAGFVAALREQITLSPRREVLIFVHGYAVTFEDSARIMAQVVHDTEFAGVPILYSWPTQGLLLSYLVDESNSEWTVPYFEQLLELVTQMPEVEHVHVLAHSMGTRVVARGIRDLMAQRGLATTQPAHPPLDQLILAAADIDAEIFERDYVPALLQAAGRTTIYVSEADWALGGSQRLHKYSRLGQGPLSRLTLEELRRIDVVDVTPFDKGLVGHFYYSQSPRVLDDIRSILSRPGARGQVEEEKYRRRLRRDFLYRMLP